METSGDELQIPEGWESILHVEHDGTIDAKYEISPFYYCGQIAWADLFILFINYLKLLLLLFLLLGLWSLIFYLLVIVNK